MRLGRNPKERPPNVMEDDEVQDLLSRLDVAVNDVIDLSAQVSQRHYRKMDGEFDRIHAEVGELRDLLQEQVVPALQVLLEKKP